MKIIKICLLLAITSSLIVAHDVTVEISTQQEVQLAQNATNTQENAEIDALEKTLNHIKKAKQAILSELRETLVIGRKAKFVAKNALKDAFVILKEQIKSTLDCIIHSE